MASTMKEVCAEFCREIASLQNSDEDGKLVNYVRFLVGCPQSSADTKELIELLHTEQSLLHYCASAKNPGNPSALELSYASRIHTTKKLLHSLHESSIKAGFPSKGLGWRTNFVLAAQQQIDKLAAEIGSQRAPASTAQLDSPPGLKQREQKHAAVTLGSVRVQAQAPKPGSASFVAQATPDRTVLQVDAPSIKTQDSTAVLASDSADPAILALQGEALSRKKEILQQKLLSLTGKGVRDLVSSSSSHSTSSSSNTSQSKSSADSSSSDAFSAISDFSKLSDTLKIKIQAAKLKAERARAKLQQIEADAQLAQLLQQAETASDDKSSSRSHGRKNDAMKPLDGRSPCLEPESKVDNAERFVIHTPRKNKPQLPSALEDPASPGPDEQTRQALQSQLEEIDARIAATKSFQANSSPEDKLRSELATLRLELEVMKKAAMNPAIQPSAITVAKESDTVKTGAMPSDKNYRFWRDTLEVQTVSGSGRPTLAAQWFAGITPDKTPQELAAECPEELRQ